MYDQQRAKRIFGRKDDLYRSDLPSLGNYYSTSSVYSYSRTSSADCPEHGGSKKKLTLILSVSIAVVILGVLSIVGVAAYLGVLSKSSSSSSSSDSPEESSSYWGNADNDDLPVKTSRADLDLTVSPQSVDVVGGSWPEIRRGNKPNDRLTTPQRISTSTSRGTPSSFVYSPVTKPYVSFPTPKPTEPEDRPIIIRAPPTTAPPDDRYYRNRHRNRHPITNSHALPPPPSTSSDNVESVTPDQPNVPELENASNSPSSDLQSNQNNLPSKPVEPTARYEDFQYDGTEPLEPTSHGNVHIRNHNVDSREPSTPNYNQDFAPLGGSVYNYDTSIPKETPSAENSKKQITFDRISPEFYDKKPWIPMLNRPNLDKRPRVDLITPPSTETASQTYDLTTELSSVKPNDTTTELSRHSLSDRVNDNDAEEETSSQVNEDLHRSDIPTFTIYIPHIPVPNASQPEEPNFQRVLLKPTPKNVTQENEKNVEDYRNQDYEYGTSSEEAAGRDDYVEDSPSTEDDTRIYKLDPDTVDIVPDTFGPAKPIMPTIQNLERDKSRHIPDNVTSSEQTGESVQFHPTVDVMNSTVDHLNLMNQAVDKFEKATEEASDSEATTFNPLFPPVRSYVAVNLPLRPKPDEVTEDEEVAKLFLLNEESRKKLKVYAENGGRLPDLTLTTKSSLTKVLSMMMDDKDASKGQSVHVVVADDGNAVLVNASDNSKSHRMPKLLHRDPKIDTKFNVQTDPVVHVPVPLIQREGSGTEQSNSTKATVTVQDSPVYKFILRKGQSVEDLLKEIFNNYTDKIPTTTEKQVVSVTVSSNKSTTIFMPPGLVKQFRPIGLPNLNLTSTPPSLILLNESISSLRPGGNILTTMNPLVKTSTSVVVNGDLEACPSNSSFRCESTGKCISGFGRCNGIRDCPDNSDEKGCLCVDLLRAQMLHRKICDGVPDCKDFSDEYQCDWCSPGQYICAGSRACVNRSKICDGKRDCPRGDDENECVKIGRSNVRDYLEDFSPTYHRSGHLMVRKKGTWGKLCLETFSSTVTHWEVKDLARAVCKALTFSDFEAVERVVDDEKNSTSPYYELVYGLNETESSESQPEEASSSESTPRTSLGFKQTQCKSRQIVEVACQDLQCGTAPRAFTQAARIVGGANALPGEWPWQAALYRDGEYQCGATLISSRWLLSAGHCFYHAQDDFWVARLGTLRRGATVLSPYEQVVRITHVVLHPQYKDVGFVNDVSLLRLEQEVNFTDFVRPVCLPGRDTKIRDGRMCTVVGWGQLFEVGRVFPDTLQEVQLPLISTGECRKRTLFLPLYKLTEEMFCAGFDRGGRDACLGDSGGPLMCPETDGRWSLYGVTSNGYGCARANRPGVYTKVASYLDWIYEKMSQEDKMIHHDKSKICSGHRCPLGECLEKRRLCNGVSDCLDGSDEKHCTWS